ARELADGPTLAHAATKQVIRDYLEGGVALADERVPAVAGALFATEDLQGAVRSFLEQGPGTARFSGR
ncbi:MAG: enoyl-CoA hydratase/isomerase family protein, partial [Solirubrobacteraceae bacterium]